MVGRVLEASDKVNLVPLRFPSASCEGRKSAHPNFCSQRNTALCLFPTTMSTVRWGPLIPVGRKEEGSRKSQEYDGH